MCKVEQVWLIKLKGMTWSHWKNCNTIYLESSKISVEGLTHWKKILKNLLVYVYTGSMWLNGVTVTKLDHVHPHHLYKFQHWAHNLDEN